MTVHVGQITSEVDAGSARPAVAPVAASGASVDEWEERVRLAARLDRIARDLLRTSTEPNDV
ncbi:MAG: hypothetical protein JJE52_16450 [Acidimicrobiia bacterium]|nr:hypothetical protein [Acidimicrobiia bacterium]